MVQRLKEEPETQVEEISNHLDYIQWWKADGTPTAGKLPQDDYHKAKFFARGWSMVDPNRRVVQENFLMEDEE